MCYPTRDYCVSRQDPGLETGVDETPGAPLKTGSGGSPVVIGRGSWGPTDGAWAGGHGSLKVEVSPLLCPTRTPTRDRSDDPLPGQKT